MQNYPIGYNPYVKAQTVPTAQNHNTTGATFNIGTGTPDAIQPNKTGAVIININGASVNPNGANINNTYNTTGAPGQAYDSSYYTQKPAGNVMQPPTVPVAASSLNNANNTNKKEPPKKNIVLLTDEYIQTLENYLRSNNPDIKLMAAKELMNRFREDESRKNDQALINLLNLTLQSKYSQVKMVGMSIIENGWTRGDALTQQLLAQIQQSQSGYGLDALDAANAALKSAGQTIKVDDLNPEYSKRTTKKDKKA